MALLPQSHDYQVLRMQKKNGFWSLHLSARKHLFTLSNKRQELLERVFEHKMCYKFSLLRSSNMFIILRK